MKPICNQASTSCHKYSNKFVTDVLLVCWLHFESAISFIFQTTKKFLFESVLKYDIERHNLKQKTIKIINSNKSTAVSSH